MSGRRFAELGVSRNVGRATAKVGEVYSVGKRVLQTRNLTKASSDVKGREFTSVHSEL